jgi:hypothetical protein
MPRADGALQAKAAGGGALGKPWAAAAAPRAAGQMDKAGAYT